MNSRLIFQDTKPRQALRGQKAVITLRDSSVFVLGALAACLLLFGAAGCARHSPGKSQTLTVFHAGSLAVPFRHITAAFNEKYPDVEVEAEAAGSRDTARKVSDLGRPCDVLGSADYKVVENLLMPKHADFNIKFATNELSIVYTDESRYKDEITAHNWPEILLRDDVAFGRADPNRDPCGYRTVMLFQLAETYFNRPGLAARLSRKDGRRYVRPKETDLLALLESGEIDYLFIYRSVGIQHGLRILRLPDEINLGSPQFEELYNTVKVRVTGRKPEELIEIAGSAIVYSVTIPRNARNRKMAEAYLQLLLSPEGRKIMEKNGQGVIAPALVDDCDNLPDSLKQYCQQEQ